MKLTFPFDLYDIARFFSKVDVVGEAECWEWMASRNPNGYGAFCALGTTFAAHRFSYMLANGKIEDPELVVRHKCDNPACVNPRHLETGTHQDNMLDRSMRMRTPRGAKNGRAKLTDEDVLAIYKDKRFSTDIARDYNVGADTVRRIKKGTGWSHITGAKPKLKML